MPTTTTSTVRPLRDARAATIKPAPVPVRLRQATGLRAATARLYASWLQTAVSRTGDRYHPKTIEAYLEALASLDDYLDRVGWTGEHADLSATELNAYLADYRDHHSTGGTWTKATRLRVFFRWLAETFDTPNPYAAKAVDRYAPPAPAQTALGAEVLTELLVTCKGKEFEPVRDRAILLLLASGVRRGEIDGLYVEDLDMANQVARVRALKDARRGASLLRIDDGQAEQAGRLIPFGHATALALHQYLRLRAKHKLTEVESGPLWYATRGRGRMTGNGIYQMVKRRAAKAGYDPTRINVHAFRHTRTHELLAAGMADGDVMALMGWKSRAMLDRYAANLAQTRAHAAVRAAGLVR